MTVRVKVRYPTPDIKKTREQNHKAMAKFVVDTLKVWVIETVNPIPVWSGAARASFLFLAAKAETSITIEPVAPSRLILGITEASAEVFSDPAKGLYGWRWESDLAHIGIVEDRVGFVAAGLRAIQNKNPKLPQPVTKTFSRANPGV